MAEKTFAELGRVEAIRSLFEGSGYAPFEEPLRLDFKSERVGSSAAAVEVSRLFLEGTDFNLVYFPFKHLGYKCTLAVSGELYAAFASPRTLAVTLGVSSKIDYEQVKELWVGVVAAAHEFSYQLLSLDLVPSRNGLAVSMSAVGESEEVLVSSAPAPVTKDLICVSGRLGAAYLGQQVLEHKSEELDKYKMLVGAYIKPELDASVLADLKESGITPTSGYFVSRGLADAALRLSRDKHLGVKIYADRIPFEGNSFALGKELNIDPLSAAMNGGDDYKLLLTIPIAQYEKFRKDFGTFDVIGHLALLEAGCVLVTPEGLEHEISAQGWKSR